MLDKSTYPRVKVCGSGLSPHAIKMLDRLGLRERFRRTTATSTRCSCAGPRVVSCG